MGIKQPKQPLFMENQAQRHLKICAFSLGHFHAIRSFLLSLNFSFNKNKLPIGIKILRESYVEVETLRKRQDVKARIREALLLLVFFILIDCEIIIDDISE